MKETLKNYIVEHSKTGEWTGKTVGGVAVVTVAGVEQPVKPFLDVLGIKIGKTTKYTVREEHAGMGESKSTGDTGDTGNGTSEEQE